MSRRTAIFFTAMVFSAVQQMCSKEQMDVRYRVSADGYYMNGNARRWYANTRLNTTFSGQTLSVSLAPTLLYGQAGNVVADRDLLVSASVQVFPKELFFWYAVAIYDFSKKNKIESRWQSGAGIGVNALQESQHALSITPALVYENTRFNSVEGNETWRWSVRIKGYHELLERTVILNHETYVQPSIEGIHDLRWRTLVSLDFPVTRSLSFRTGVENNHESVVLTGRKQDDLRWTFGVAVGN